MANIQKKMLNIDRGTFKNEDLINWLVFYAVPKKL